MAHSFQYRGTLAETALPEMFFTIFRHRVPGLIDITRDGVTKRIYIHDGNVLHASSTDRADRLGACLYRSGKLSREDLQRTIRQLTSTHNVRHGQILIEEDLLTPSELYEAIRDQMEAIVWSVFSWQEGEVSFRIGEFNEPTVKIHLPMRQVILRGIKRIQDARSLVSRLGNKKTVMRPAYCTEDLIEIALDRDEFALLRLVDGERTLYDVCTDGPYAVSENARLLYAFHVLQMIQRVETSPETPGVMIRLGGDSTMP